MYILVSWTDLASNIQQQIEQNLKYDFSLTGDDGKALEPVFGPGLTGLANLGNRYVSLCGQFPVR